MLDSLSPPRIAPGNHPRPAAPPAMPQHGERERQTDGHGQRSSGTDDGRRTERGRRRRGTDGHCRTVPAPRSRRPTQPAQAITASRQEINQTRPASSRAASRPAWTAGENRRGKGERGKGEEQPRHTQPPAVIVIYNRTPPRLSPAPLAMLNQERPAARRLSPVSRRAFAVVSILLLERKQNSGTNNPE